MKVKEKDFTKALEILLKDKEQKKMLESAFGGNKCPLKK